jgi:hypothetical protein
MAHLHNVMLSADLYKLFTMKELIHHLEKMVSVQASVLVKMEKSDKVVL